MDNQENVSDNVQTEVEQNQVQSTNNQVQEQTQNQVQSTDNQAQQEKKFRVVLMVRYNTNLNARPDEQTVKNYFSTYGEVANVFFPKLQTNNAFVFMKTLNNNESVRNIINLIRQECNNSFTIDVAHRPNVRQNEGSAFVPRTNYNIQQNNMRYMTNNNSNINLRGNFRQNNLNPNQSFNRNNYFNHQNNNNLNNVQQNRHNYFNGNYRQYNPRVNNNVNNQPIDLSVNTSIPLVPKRRNPNY